MERYLGNLQRPLSRQSRFILQHLAHFGEQMETLYAQAARNRSELNDDEKQHKFDLFAPINNLAYSAVFVGKNKGGRTTWTFDFVPMVFAKLGFPQVSPIKKLVLQPRGEEHTEEMRREIHANELELQAYLMSLPGRKYQANPGITLH